jgi:lipoprotein-releasing system permease protein
VGSVRAYPLFIGLRYSFSRKRNRFTAVVSLVSMLGMVLGVASLIVVLSVMNGFAMELRERILSLVPHGYLEFRDPQDAADWQDTREQALTHPRVEAVAPFLRSKVLLAGSGSLQGATLFGVLPSAERDVSRLAGSMVEGSLERMEETPFGLVLGASLARMMALRVGDSVVVTLPQLTVTPLGAFPRSKRLTVVGVFQVGAQQDAEQVYVSLATAQRLLGAGDAVTGLQVRSDSLFAAPQVMAELGARLPALHATDWSQTQGSLFRAVRMEKITVALLLLSVVAVAAFNIVSTLVMSVTEKRGDIAVLRTLGASAGSMMAVFMVHGLALALFGIGVGAVLGVVAALNISSLVAWLEGLTGTMLFDPSVYFITSLPSQLQAADVVAVLAASLLLSLLATVYPALRAARIAPAEVLRYA